MSLLTASNLLQFFKYALAGGIATFVHIIVFHGVCWRVFPALQEKDLAVRFFHLTPAKIDDTTRSKHSIYGNVIAFFIANMVAYVINVLWIFEAGRHNIAIEILLFYAVSGFSIFLGTILMGILIRRFHLLTTWAFGANIFCSVLFNFILRKFIIFAG